MNGCQNGKDGNRTKEQGVGRQKMEDWNDGVMK